MQFCINKNFKKKKKKSKTKHFLKFQLRKQFVDAILKINGILVVFEI